MTIIKNTLTRKPTRLKNYDYSLNGYYFVTICTYNRQKIFGKIQNGKIILNNIGNMVDDILNQISEKYCGVNVDKYIIMPNHVHLIINIVGAIHESPDKNTGLYNGKNNNDNSSK